MMTAFTLLQEAARAPLPAAPPISGPFWTIWVPAALLLVSVAGTWALWRHFATKGD